MKTIGDKFMMIMVSLKGNVVDEVDFGYLLDLEQYESVNTEVYSRTCFTYGMIHINLTK